MKNRIKTYCIRKMSGALVRTVCMALPFVAIFGLTAANAETRPSNADPQSTLPYPTIKEMHDDCKAAIGLAENDVPAFLHTSCASRLNGIYNGLYLVLARVQPLANGPNEPCFSTKESMYKDLTNIFCIPGTKHFPKNKPLELQLARDLVHYIETKYPDTPVAHLSKEYPVLDMGVLFTDMYRCNPQSKGEKK